MARADYTASGSDTIASQADASSPSGQALVNGTMAWGYLTREKDNDGNALAVSGDVAIVAKYHVDTNTSTFSYLELAACVQDKLAANSDRYYATYTPRTNHTDHLVELRKVKGGIDTQVAEVQLDKVDIASFDGGNHGLLRFSVADVAGGKALRIEIAEDNTANVTSFSDPKWTVVAEHLDASNPLADALERWGLYNNFIANPSYWGELFDIKAYPIS